MNQPSFILVHGAWHNSYCWHLIAPILRQKNHQVFVTDFSTKAANHHYKFASYYEEALQFCKIAPPPLILVGHSMGGAVVNQLYNHIVNLNHNIKNNIKALVYIAGCLPQNGESISNIFVNAQVKSMLSENLIITKKTNYIDINQEKICDIFYNNCYQNKKKLFQYKSYIVTQSLKALQEPLFINESQISAISKYYIECLQDNAIDIAVQKNIHSKFNHNMSLFSLDADHSPFYSQPENLAAILQNIAK